MSKLQRVIIVGGGFAGIRAARELARDHRFHVLLISDRADFEYHAALYRSATGRSPLEVSIPLHRIFPHNSRVEVIRDKVESINAKTKVVAGEDGCTYEYDHLILAPGTITQYFGIGGLKRYSFGIKSSAEALRFKHHLHDQLLDPETLDLDYVVVGAGPTGTELAGELVSYLNRIYTKHQISSKYFQVSLVEAGPRILPSLPEAASELAVTRLRKLGVRMYINTPVKGETSEHLHLPSGKIRTRTVVWTAGIANSPLLTSHKKMFTFGKAGRVSVNARLEGAPNIHVLGDSADTQYSGWAQTALYDGWFVATNLRRELSEKKPLHYHPKKPVGAVPIGPLWCMAVFPHLILFGFLGWQVRRLMDLKLFTTLLPLKLGLRSWLYGHKNEENGCPVCSPL